MPCVYPFGVSRDRIPYGVGKSGVLIFRNCPPVTVSRFAMARDCRSYPSDEAAMIADDDHNLHR